MDRKVAKSNRESSRVLFTVSPSAVTFHSPKTSIKTTGFALVHYHQLSYGLHSDFTHFPMNVFYLALPSAPQNSSSTLRIPEHVPSVTHYCSIPNSLQPLFCFPDCPRNGIYYM